MSSKKNPRVLLVIAANPFDDHQYSQLREALEAAGAKVDVASTVKENARGLHGLRVNPDLLIDEVQPENYDGVVFVGGHGSSQYWHDVYAHDIVLNVYRRGGLVAAIERAPVTLGEAGVLKGRRATGSVSVYEKMSIFSGEFTADPVTRDGNIITAEGNRALPEFVKAVISALKEVPAKTSQAEAA